VTPEQGITEEDLRISWLSKHSISLWIYLRRARLSSTNKKPKKILRILQNFQTSENSTDFSNCVPIKNSEEKSAEILPAGSTKKLALKKFLISRKNLWIFNFLNLSENLSEGRYFLDRTKARFEIQISEY
jgi:hypothetical protein